MSERITETCSCGASIEFVGPIGYAKDRLSEWRVEHKHDDQPSDPAYDQSWLDQKMLPPVVLLSRDGWPELHWTEGIESFEFTEGEMKWLVGLVGDLRQKLEEK